MDTIEQLKAQRNIMQIFREGAQTLNDSLYYTQRVQQLDEQIAERLVEEDKSLNKAVRENVLKAMEPQLEELYKKQAEGVDGMRGGWKEMTFREQYLQATGGLKALETLASEMRMYCEFRDLCNCVIWKIQADERDKGMI